MTDSQPISEPGTADEALLERLEHEVITGALASRARKELMVKLANDGMPKVDIMRRVNRVREMRSMPPLSYSAIERTIGRYQ